MLPDHEATVGRMNISAILCTYNRCQDLTKALDTIAVSKLPESVEWEVLVVDNNSRDQTRAVAEDFCRRYPGRFRYLFEARQGKSHALNAGIRESRGDILAFMDDDVTVDSTWLQNLTAPLLDGKWVGVGGPVLPQRQVELPKWISLDERYALGPLVMFDLGPNSAELTEAPFGTNMAFQKKMFDKYGGFRTDLGPQPGSEIRGEDSEFVYRLLEAGERLGYEPSALVYHSIPENRLRKEYFLAWWFDKGRADVRALGTPPETRWLLGGVPLIWFRRLIMWTLRWMTAFESSRRFSCKLKVCFVAGQITESCRLRHKVRSNQHEQRCEKNAEYAAGLTTDSVANKEIS